MEALKKVGIFCNYSQNFLLILSFAVFVVHTEPCEGEQVVLSACFCVPFIVLTPYLCKICRPSEGDLHSLSAVPAFPSGWRSAVLHQSKPSITVCHLDQRQAPA